MSERLEEIKAAHEQREGGIWMWKQTGWLISEVGRLQKGMFLRQEAAKDQSAKAEKLAEALGSIGDCISCHSTACGCMESNMKIVEKALEEFRK